MGKNTIEFTEEEQQEFSKIAPLIKKASLAVIEARLSAQMGTEKAAEIIAKAESFVNEGLTSNEVINRLRKVDSKAVPTAVIIPYLVPNLGGK